LRKWTKTLSCKLNGLSMKSDVVFGLENAAWPALLVESGAVCRSNAAALRLLGRALESKNAPLTTIWSPENPLPPEEFFARWEQSPAATVLIKFRTAAGDTVPAPVSVCSFTAGGTKYFLLQLLPEAAASLRVVGLDGEAGAAHNQKLDCALQLARAVALDFNNALTSILGHTSLLLSRLDPGHPWRDSLIEVEKSASRAAEIASDLGAFSRQVKENRAQPPGNLNLQVQRCVTYFQQKPGSPPIEWTLQLERKLLTAKFDEAKMQQALLRIMENAVQALRDRGRITVQTRNLQLTEPTQDRNVQLAAGAYVCAEISDNGCGIDPGILPRVFEPFFTTKRSPHRGIGLAWVYGIATNQGGGVAISSKPEIGTSVRIYLPAEKRMIREHSVSGDDLSGSGQTVLMVDDEDLLLTMGQTILSAYGYRVLTASSGQRALDVFTSQNQTIDLVITDLVMPSMSGRELIEHLRQLAPDTRILCTSGYIWPAGQEDSRAYLQKPFTSQELLLKVKEMLAGAS
jgi:two-component system, cell cycle sensor histidine kinase and response regulator CckA